MTQQKIVRHPYGDLLAPISLLTFFLNLHTKCQAKCWYTYFFFYNFFASFGIALECTRPSEEPISDTSFYTMVGFQSVGTLALAINLVWITVRTLCNRFRRTPKPETVVHVSDAVTRPGTIAVV